MKLSLLGNQNSGKTTLFNALTGLNQQIGNWPGVTIERKEGIIKDTSLTIVDLPGVYSLSPYTSEEEVTRNYILNEKPDLIINIIDATCLERSLYLTTQLLELDSDVILVLNMCDTLAKKGIVLDEKILEKELGISVVKISAIKKEGIDDLINLIKDQSYKKNKHQKIFDNKIESLISKFSLKTDSFRFTTLKMLEDDPVYHGYKTPKTKEAIKQVEEEYNLELPQVIADQRYKYITNIRSKAIIEDSKKETITDKLDKIFLNKYLAIPLFIIIMSSIYCISVGIVGKYTTPLMEYLTEDFHLSVEIFLAKCGAHYWSASLVCDGIINGVGAALNFVPQLLILFFFISLLESSGYMNRIAFMLDRVFRKFGLNGKSLIPFIVGTGCSVPGILTSRTIEDETEKRITIMTTSFMPCSAKLPIMALIVGYFFPNNSGLVTVSFYFLAIIVILISSLILKKIFKSKSSSYISELPEYKLPSFKLTIKDALNKTMEFIKKAFSVILLCSVLVWFLGNFSFDLSKGMVKIDESILASIGRILSYVFYPILGELNWAATVSALQGLVAKEQVVSSMQIIAALSGSEDIFSSPLFSNFTALSAYSYSIFVLFSAPCVAAISAMKKELGSTRKMFQAVAFQTLLAYLLASLIFGIGKLISLL